MTTQLNEALNKINAKYPTMGAVLGTEFDAEYDTSIWLRCAVEVEINGMPILSQFSDYEMNEEVTAFIESLGFYVEFYDMETPFMYLI